MSQLPPRPGSSPMPRRTGPHALPWFVLALVAMVVVAIIVSARGDDGTTATRSATDSDQGDDSNGGLPAFREGTPQEAFAGMVEAARNGDCTAFGDYLSQDFLDLAGTSRQEWVDGCERTGASAAFALDERRELGDITVLCEADDQVTLKVEWIADGETTTEQDVLVREDGRWRLGPGPPPCGAGGGF
ncbi:MAG: hypothetical protein ACRD2C_19630 [Acidimicrobiales bacterium]